MGCAKLCSTSEVILTQGSTIHGLPSVREPFVYQPPSLAANISGLPTSSSCSEFTEKSEAGEVEPVVDDTVVREVPEEC